jgi:hypothetical protein
MAQELVVLKSTVVEYEKNINLLYSLILIHYDFVIADRLLCSTQYGEEGRNVHLANLYFLFL